jgi:hypothetical protein
MTRAQVDTIKGSTQSKGKWGPWKDHYEEMARKTVVRRIAKYLPLTPELADAFALEDEADRSPPRRPTLPEQPKGTAGLKAIVQQKAAGATVEAQAEPRRRTIPQTGEVHEGEIGALHRRDVLQRHGPRDGGRVLVPEVSTAGREPARSGAAWSRSRASGGRCGTP